MEAKVTWNGQMSFDGLTDFGFIVPLDASQEAGGSEHGPRPMELLAISLAGCTGMDVISILRKKQQQVVEFEIRVHADRAAHPPAVFSRIVLEYIVTGKQIDPTAVERAIQLSAEKYCPVQAMLKVGLAIEHKSTILEAV